IVQCENDGVGLDALVDLALGGQTVLWQETNGGNNLEVSISKATLTRPKEQEVSYVENGGGAAGDPAGDWTGALVGHGSLLAFEGSQLVGLTRKDLLIWTLPDTEPRRTIPLIAAKRVLEDLDGGVAVLGFHGTTELIRLADDRRATFPHAAHAQLEPQGLYFTDGRTLRFVPRS